MAELGTVGAALDRARAASPPPVDPNVTTSTDPKPDDKADYTGVQTVVADNRRQMDSVLDRMRSDDARLATLEPPKLQPMPQQPQQQDTPPAERWGSMAMLFAGLGSLLTRQPLTTALNSMAEVNHAFNENDMQRAKQSLDAWKIQSDNAIKLNDFQNRAYEGALKKIDTDRRGAIAEANVIAHSLKDNVVLGLIQAGRGDEAMRMLGARATQGAVLNQRTEQAAADADAWLAWNNAHPNATAQEKAAARQTIWAAHRMPTNTGERPTGSASGRTLDEIKQDLSEQHPEWTPGQLDLEASRQLASAKHTDSLPAMEVKDVKASLRTAHPDWDEGHLDTEANRIIMESKQAVMSDEAAELNAQVALKTGHAPTTMGRSQSNIQKFQDAYARVAKQQNMSAEDIAAAQVKFTGEMSQSRSLGTTSARIDFGARELDVALPQALELSEKVYRPGFKKAAEIQQALQGQSNDPDLLEFAQQNQAVMSAYAQVMSRGGVSTVSAMDRAEKLLSTATSQQGYMRQIDRLHKEVQTMLYGAESAKRALQNEITGRDDPLPPPQLTNVPRPAEAGRGGSGSATSSPPAAAVAHLKENPNLAPAFDEKYGPGAAERILNGR